MKHMLSVSLGSSGRDKTAEVGLFAEHFLLERHDADPGTYLGTPQHT